MFSPEFQEACNRALERLSSGASLTEVLALILAAAERQTRGSCAVLIRDPEGTIRVSSTPGIDEGLIAEIEAIGLETTGSLSGRGVWWEPIFGRDTLAGAFVLHQEAGDPSEADRAFAGACAHLAAIAIDRKRREDELRDRELAHRTVLDAVIDGIVTIDQRGIIETFNRSAERMFGYRADEVIGKNVSILMGPEDASRHDDYINRYLDTGQRRIIGIGREVMGRRKDGTMFPLDLGVSEVEIGDARKFTGVMRDMTERKKLEAEARQSQKLEAVGTLAAGVAHDFNNVLMGIMGCTSIALTKIPPDSPARPFLQEAKSAAERGSRLTRQLLAFSRRAPAERRPISINDVVTGTDVMLGRLIGESLRLFTELEATGTIMADVGQIEQVLVNLVVNARDAIEGAGTITIRTEGVQVDWRPNEPRGKYVCLTVEDTGSGMDEATRSRIFEPFFTTKSPDRGTGLGLSTVYGIVEQHGGFIEVDSEPGGGTVVRVYFQQSDEGTAQREETEVGLPGGVEVILVVEDDRLVRLAVSHALRDFGYQVREASTGSEAIDLVKSQGAPDLMLTDLILPDMGGVELATKVRKRARKVRVLFMSGYEDREQLAASGPGNSAFIAKPFSDEQLMRKIREVLDAPRSVPRT